VVFHGHLANSDDTIQNIYRETLELFKQQKEENAACKTGAELRLKATENLKQKHILIL